MLQKIFLIAAALLLLVLQNAGATPPESDTVWTRNFGFSGRFEFVQNDEYIIMGGSSGIYRIRSSDGKVVNEYKKFASLYGFNQDKTKLIFSNDFSIFTMDFDTEIISDSIIIEKTNKYKYVDGDTTNPWEESYFLAPLTSPDGKYILCSWFRSGYRFSSYDYEFIETRTMIIINTETKKIEKEIEIVPNAKCFSPDGNYLAIGKSGKEGIVELFDAKTFEFVRRIVVLEGTITDLNFSMDSKYLCCTYAIQKCKVINLENSEVAFPDDNTKDDLIIQTEFYNKKNTVLYKELKWINNKRVLFFNEYDIEKKLKTSKFANLNIDWIFPGLFCISKNDNYLSVLAYSENKDILLVLIQNNITKVGEKSEIKKNNIKIIPNPIDNILKIDFENQIINKIEIIDINSNSIFKEEITTEENSKIINTSKLPIGVYFLRITTNQEIETYKFIKE